MASHRLSLFKYHDNSGRSSFIKNALISYIFGILYSELYVWFNKDFSKVLYFVQNHSAHMSVLLTLISDISYFCVYKQI